MRNARPPARAGIGFAIAAAALYVVAAWSSVTVRTSADATSHIQTAYSFILEGDADIDEYVGLAPPLDAFRARIGEHWYAPYTSGNALLIAPAAAVALLLCIDPTSIGGVSVFPKLLASALVAISVALVHLTVRRIVDARVALYITFAYAFATNVFVAGHALVQHPASLALVAAGMYAALVRGPRAAAVIGLVGGLAIIVRPANAMLVAALVAVVAREERAAGFRAVVWMLPAAAFQATVAALAYGTPFATGGPLPLGSLPEGLVGQLVAPSRGLLVYAPWLVASLAALAWSWHGPADRERWLLRFGSLAWLGVWILFSWYAEWWGGFTFGNRYMSDVAPLYALALADAWRRGWMRHALARGMLAIAIGWAVLLQAAGAGLWPFTWNGVHWDLTPHIDATPWRVWDWGDAQWQFVLRRLVNDPGPAMIVEASVILGCVAAFALLAHARSARTCPA